MKEELILEIIKERWSPYAFSSVQVEEYRIKAMFQAASHAPSCNNEQPWLFVYTTNQDVDIFNDYLTFMDDSNSKWAKYAYAIIISMARIRFSVNGYPNKYALFDTGMAVANLLQQAMAMDIYVHQMAGFSSDRVKKYLSLPPEVEPVTMMAVGYLGDGISLAPDDLKRDETRRPRKPVNEITFRNNLYCPAF